MPPFFPGGGKQRFHIRRAAHIGLYRQHLSAQPFQFSDGLLETGIFRLQHIGQNHIKTILCIFYGMRPALPHGGAGNQHNLFFLTHCVFSPSRGIVQSITLFN